jgi:hypothetical protein
LVDGLASDPSGGYPAPVPQDLDAILQRYSRTNGGRSPNRHKELVKRYGITEATYNAILRQQGGVCAICHQPETVIGMYGQPDPLGVDHDHITDRIRGLLCRGCNAALGLCRDDPNVLRAAAAYLDQGGVVGKTLPRG